MEPLDGFQVTGTRGCSRPTGEVTLEQGVDLVLAAIVFAQRKGLRDLLVNVAGASRGARPPTVRVAMVIQPEMIDPGRTA